MRYDELLLQAESTMKELGIRDYCQNVCAGGCCRQAGHYDCTRFKECGGDFCRTRLACSVFICRRLSDYLAIVAPVTVQLLAAIESHVRTAIESWLEQRGKTEKTAADSGDLFGDILNEQLAERGRPGAYFADYDFAEIRDLAINTSFPSLDGSSQPALPLGEVAAIKELLSARCRDNKPLRGGRQDYQFTRVGSSDGVNFEGRTYLGSDRKKYLIIRPRNNTRVYGCFGPVERNYPFETPQHMPRIDHTVDCSDWEAAETKLANLIGL